MASKYENEICLIPLATLLLNYLHEASIEDQYKEEHIKGANYAEKGWVSDSGLQCLQSHGEFLNKNPPG